MTSACPRNAVRVIAFGVSVNSNFGRRLYIDTCYMIIDHAHADDDDEATPVKGAADNILDRTVTFIPTFASFLPCSRPFEYR